MWKRRAVFDLGDALLYTVSAWRQCPWQAFRRAFDGLYARRLSTSGATEEPDANVRLNAARVLDALGHCDVVFCAGTGNVFAAPSALAELPVAGLPRAVLCGSRSPESLDVLRAAARRAARFVQVRASSQTAANPFAPARIEVQAASAAVLRAFAEDVGVLYEDPPPAWSLAGLSGSLQQFLESLNWSRRPDLNWKRTDFDPGQLRFVGRRDPDAALILSRYQDPVRGRWSFWMWRGGEGVEVDDPSWGRYAVLAACGRTVVQYDRVSGQFAVPASVPLPGMLSRAVSLCSGHALATAPPSRAAGGPNVRMQVYRDVPSDVYRVCAEKIGQLPTGGAKRADGINN
jgi:hypothetical protein